MVTQAQRYQSQQKGMPVLNDTAQQPTPNPLQYRHRCPDRPSCIHPRFWCQAQILLHGRAGLERAQNLPYMGELKIKTFYNQIICKI